MQSRSYSPLVIWCASDQLARRWFRVRAFDDAGQLTIAGSTVSFHGLRQTIELRRVRTVDFVPPSRPWAAIILVTIFSSYALWKGTPLLLVLMIAGGPAVLLLLLSFSRWVRITFETDNGGQANLWFADGGRQGWSGLFGGNRKLFDAIQNSIVTSQADSGGDGSTPIVLGALPPPDREKVEQDCPYCEKRIVPNDGRCPACDRPI